MLNVLNEFCHTNRHVKVLEMNGVGLIMDDLDLTNADLSEASPVIITTTLDKLVLNDVEFKSQAAALEFAELVSCLKISSLELGEVVCHFAGDLPEMVAHLIKESPVKRLALLDRCNIATFRAALTTGKSTVEALSVDFNSN